jgi:hypothetical protein
MWSGFLAKWYDHYLNWSWIMYAQVDATLPPKAAEYQFLKLWVHNELTKLRHHSNTGWALIKRGAQISSEQGFKCERPEGTVYFLFPPSVIAEEGDVISWGAASGAKDEWLVTSTNRVREFIRCEVKRPQAVDRSIDDLLRSASMQEAADYLRNASQRLAEGTAVEWSDCVANCRNALQTAVGQLTGEGHLPAGVKKLKEVCGFGDRELEYVQAVDALLLASKNLLSKSGAHPPPDYHFAAFAMDQTVATLRFIVCTYTAKRESVS